MKSLTDSFPAGVLAPSPRGLPPLSPGPSNVWRAVTRGQSGAISRWSGKSRPATAILVAVSVAAVSVLAAAWGVSQVIVPAVPASDARSASQSYLAPVVPFDPHPWDRDLEGAWIDCWDRAQ